jgi:hypothetical protein
VVVVVVNLKTIRSGRDPRRQFRDDGGLVEADHDEVGSAQNDFGLSVPDVVSVDGDFRSGAVLRHMGNDEGVIPCE